MRDVAGDADRRGRLEVGDRLGGDLVRGEPGERAGRGGAAGAATGQEGFGGRAGGAALGSALSPLSQLSQSNVANRILRSKEGNRTQGNEMFEDVFKNPEVGERVKPVLNQDSNYDFNKLKTYMTKKERVNIADYFKDPTMSKAHKAQSDLGKKIRSVKAGPDFVGRSKAIDTLEDFQESIQRGLNRSLKNKSPELPVKYSKAKEYWKGDVVPYDTVKHKGEPVLDLYKNKKLYANETNKKLIKSREFRESLNRKHNKELALRNALNKIYGKAGASAFGLGGPAAIYLGLKERPYNNYGEQ